MQQSTERLTCLRNGSVGERPPQAQMDPLTGLCTNQPSSMEPEEETQQFPERQEASRHGSLPPLLLMFPLQPPQTLPSPVRSLRLPQFAPHLTVASKSSVLFRRWSKFSPRAKILSTFWVMIFLTPSTSLCRFLTRSFPAPPLASSWMSIQGLIRPSGEDPRGQRKLEELK